MRSLIHTSLLALLATLAVWVSSARAKAANWVTVKNDTGKTITIQETTVVNGQVKRGKATNLLAGETYREFLPAPATKRVEVFEATNPNLALWSGNLNCKDEAQTFSVTTTAGKVSVGQVVHTAKK